MISNFSAIAYLEDEVNRRVAERLPEYLLTMPSEEDRSEEDRFVEFIIKNTRKYANFSFDKFIIYFQFENKHDGLLIRRLDLEIALSGESNFPSYYIAMDKLHNNPEKDIRDMYDDLLQYVEYKRDFIRSVFSLLP